MHSSENFIKQKTIEEKNKEIIAKDKEIEMLRKYIEENSLSKNNNAKGKSEKGTEKGINSQIAEFEKKERLNQINTFRLEEE